MSNSEPQASGRRRFLAAAGAGVAGLALGGNALASAESTIANGTHRYRDKVVLITGATSGIGEATAHAYAREGAKVFFCGRREDRGRAVEKAIRDAGGEATFMRADVREEAQVKAFVDRCVEVYGGLDIAFNNAGITGQMDVLNKLALNGVGSYQDIMRTNVDGVLFAMRHELPVMLARGSGIIVNTGSALSHRGSAQMPAYAASKHAVIGLTRSAAAQGARHGIRVVSVSPAGTRTDIMRPFLPEGTARTGGGENTPMGRIAEPEEIAAVVLAVTDPAALFLNGDDIKADGAALA
jgi:NAD(P)-dependent dehydrogenase (short-subunit alcohol dehydrogenase family)